MELVEEKQSRVAGGSSGKNMGFIVLLSILTPVVMYLNVYVEIAGWIAIIILMGDAVNNNRYFEKAAYACLGLLALSVFKAFPFGEILVADYMTMTLIYTAIVAVFIILLYYNLYCGMRESKRE